MKSVYLRSSYYEIKVSDEGYQQILALVEQSAVCPACQKQYSADNPNVSGLVCLSCFQKDHTYLTFQGQLDQHQSLYAPFEIKTYWFLNAKGHAYTTRAGAGTNEDIGEDSALTLRHWQFPVPQKARKSGRNIDTSGYNWTIYGDVKTDDIVIIQHGSSFFNDELLFVVQRNEKSVQIDRRKKLHRAQLVAAREVLLATQNAYGMYFVQGEWTSSIRDCDVYELIVQRLNEELKKEVIS